MYVGGVGGGGECVYMCVCTRVRPCVIPYTHRDGGRRDKIHAPTSAPGYTSRPPGHGWLGKVSWGQLVGGPPFTSLWGQLWSVRASQLVVATPHLHERQILAATPAPPIATRRGGG